MSGINNRNVLRFEIENFRLLIIEDLEKIEFRIRYSSLSSRRLPSHVSTEDCPPSLDQCPEYYNL